jgi:outer membrane protein assembly factor BamB
MIAPRVLAIAATLALLLGGMGIVFGGPLRTSRAPEPSAIPAASFATPAPISKAPELPDWTAPAPDETGYDEFAHLVASGRIFRAFSRDSGPQYIQAVDTATGKVLWEKQIATEAGILVASDDILVVAELYATSQDQDPTHHLVGLDAQSGIQRWDVKLAGPPAAATLMGDRVMVLGWNNTLDALAIQDGQQIYSVDVGGKSQWPNGLPIQFANFSYEPGRMAAIGSTVAVVLADGSVAAIDGETGTGLWWIYRSLQGAAAVRAVGDHLLIDLGGTYIPPQGGSPVPILPTPATPEASNCNTQISKQLAGTSINGTSALDYIGALYAVDPVSGTIAWSGTTELYGRSQVSTSNNDLLLDTSVRSGPAQVQGTWCSLAMESGTITPLTDPASIALGSFINDVNNGRIMETVAIFANGQFVAYPTQQPVDSGTPVFDLSPYLSGSFWWVEIYDGSIYISMGDGTLMKLVASG